jgi:hypothetical protein
MNPFIAFKAVAVLAAAVILGISVAMPSSSGVTLKRIHDPRRVTYSIHLRSCHVRHGGRLPDRSCTPGSVDPAVRQANIRSTICRAGWTKKVRPSSWRTEWAKYRVAYPAYHLRGGVRSELDHLVPLELGGSNDITNLWPEVGKLPNPKDKVENALNHAVCDGRVSLAAAQQAIASDWLTAIARLGLGGPPSPRPSRSPTSPPPPGPSPSPTHATPALSCQASMSNPAPRDYSADYVQVTTTPYAAVSTVAYYRTTSTRENGQADGNGQASIGYYTSRATLGYTVIVDVTVTFGGHTASCSTSFTPSG